MSLALQILLFIVGVFALVVMMWLVADLVVR